MAGGGGKGVTLQPPFPGLDLDLEAPLLLNVWQPHEALPGRCYLKHGKNPCVLCQQSEVPRCAARPSGIFRWPPLCRAAMGCRLSWPWARGAPFHVEEMLPLGGGVGKGKLNRKCPIYSELGDVGRVLDPVNSQKTPPHPPSNPLPSGPLVFNL